MRPPKNGVHRPIQPGQVCRVCGCTDGDCTWCMTLLGVLDPDGDMGCFWVEPNLCSACAPAAKLEVRRAMAGECLLIARQFIRRAAGQIYERRKKDDALRLAVQRICDALDIAEADIKRGFHKRKDRKDR